jgi:hypothetical protein
MLDASARIQLLTWFARTCAEMQRFGWGVWESRAANCNLLADDRS